MKYRANAIGRFAVEHSHLEGGHCSSGLSRREFLGTLGALGAAASLPAALPTSLRTAGLFAQTGSSAKSTLGRIDVHHHLYPPAYVKAMADDMAKAGFHPPTWTPQTSIQMMDEAGVATAMLSPVQRLVMDSMSDKSERARSLTRQSNEYNAQLVTDFPGRFGMLAALPLPDQDGSLKEIEYSFDTLKADGIALWTDYIDKWPGDPAFASVFDELNRRRLSYFSTRRSPPAAAIFPGSRESSNTTSTPPARSTVLF